MTKNVVSFLIIGLLIVNFIVWKSYLPFLAAVFISAIFFYWAKKNPIAGSSIVTILILAGVLLRLAYLSDTPFNVRTHDVGGHIEYINYILTNNFSLPDASDCWQCYHPPLYYIISAGTLCLFSKCQLNGMLLQILSLILNFGFLFFGIKLLRLYIPPGLGERYFNIAAALLIFWPSGIIHSVRIGNDSLLYFFMAAGIYFIAKWLADGEKNNIWFAVLFVFFCLITKNNGLLIMGAIGIAWIIRFIWNNNKKELLSLGLPVLFILAFVTALVFLNPIKNNYLSDGIGGVLVGNISKLGDEVKVDNKIENLINFDSKIFLQNAFTDPWLGEERQYFTNFLVKTALFGEFRFWQPVLQKIAILMNYLIIGMIFMIIIFTAFIIRNLKNSYKMQDAKILLHLFAILTIVMSVMALMIFRYVNSFSCSGDFRYIFPIVILISALIGIGLQNLGKARFLLAGAIGEIFVSVFIVASFLFFISLVFLKNI